MLRFKSALLPAILMLTFALCACGIRPSQVDPPPGAEKLKFPRTYPDPDTINTPEDKAP